MNYDIIGLYKIEGVKILACAKCGGDVRAVLKDMKCATIHCGVQMCLYTKSTGTTSAIAVATSCDGCKSFSSALE